MAFYRATVNGHLEGGEIFNFTVHFLAPSAQAAVMAIDMATAVTKMWSGVNVPAGNIEALYPAAIGVDGVVVDELDSAGKNVSQGRASLALVGTGVEEPLPPQCAVVVSTRTDVPTRKGRGRFFLPSPVVTTVIDQRLDSAAQTDILNGALAMLNSMKADTWLPVVYHRGFDSGDEIFSIDVGDVFDTQRRRRNKLVETRLSHTLT
jgi:hypothetical protein